MTNPANRTVLISGAGGGHILNVSSLAGWIGSKGLSAYCGSKFGLCGFALSLARDLEDTGVRRNKLHVFPDRYSRKIHYIARFAPWLLPILDRRLQKQAIEL